MTEDQKLEAPANGNWRPVFIVSDGTAITAETLAHSVLTQFPNLSYDRERIPFIDTVEKAKQTAERINAVQRRTGVRPLVFSTFVDPVISRSFINSNEGFQIELFRSFVGPLEHELCMKQAEVILVGVSRSGKTPTSLFLAMQFGIKVANYPLIPEDFDRGELPEVLLPLRNKLFGLSIKPERLSEIRNERRPGSRYASIENCREEIRNAERLMTNNGIEWLNSTTKSIEEIAATIVAKFHLQGVSNRV